VETGEKGMNRLDRMVCLAALLSWLWAPAAVGFDPVAEGPGRGGGGHALLPLSDEQLAAVAGRALFNLSYLAPGDAGNPNGSGSGIGFYTLGVEAELAINANIRTLQAGCGGVNGSDACDLDIQNFSLGCIANSAGQCTSLPPQDRQKAGAVSDAAANQQRLRDFILTNPFLQFAVRNPGNPATREIIGLRLGAQDVKGPLSFGSLNSFSGYMTGLANLDIQEQGPRSQNLSANQEDVAITCKDPNVCPDAAGRSAFTGMADYRYLGLDDKQVCLLIVCTRYRNLTASFLGVKRNNLPVSVNGARVTQATIANLNLGRNTINGQDGAVKAIVDTLEIERSSTALSPDLLNTVLPILKDDVKANIVTQFANGLGTTVAALDNDTYLLPYNLRNVHQVEVASALFGLALSKESLQYPGYTAPVNRGWSLYMPDAFTLNIADRTTTFVQNIALYPYARNGDIVGLEAPYRNCWGSTRFC
jgi:hypothetical protein